MIKKLRIKFIVMAMVAVFVLLALVVTGMNILNHRAVVEEAQTTLAIIAQNKGDLPVMDIPNALPPGVTEGEGSLSPNQLAEMESSPAMDQSDQSVGTDGTDAGADGSGTVDQNGTTGQNGTKDQNGTEDQNGITDQNGTTGQNGTKDQNGTVDQNGTGVPEYEMKEDHWNGEMPTGMSPESLMESRFFSVLLSEDQTVLETNTQEIFSVSEEDAVSYAKQVAASGKKEGFIGDYLFKSVSDDDGIRITFLDCGRKLAASRRFLLLSLIAAAVGYAIFFFVIFFYSKRITRPVAESYEKQKRFITDAGHEIKTPLAIIKADADVLEMDYENNEWIEDIQKQAERLTGLTNDLVSLARMEETKNLASRVEFPLTEVVSEEVSAYRMLAEAQEKSLELDAEPEISLEGEEKSIRRLVNILMDNAMKYSPEGSAVRIKLKKQGKQVQLSVWNQTKEEISKDNLELLFDRFYRLDSSRNSETGGHGIGLSMAKAISESHGGKISASSVDGRSLQMDVVLPISVR